MQADVDVAVIGAGAAGALVCVHLARAAPGLRAALIGPGPAGVGVAYSTLEPEHLLNVPASRMGARAEAPDEFLAWLRARGGSVSGDAFVPRALFGEYVHDLLFATRSPLFRITSHATALSGDDASLRIGLEDGRTITATIVVLAVGMLSHPLPRPVRERARRAWDPGALEGISPDTDLLLLGSGLTMVDVALALSRRGHRGTLHVLSRHGLLPAPHAPAPAPRVPFAPRTTHLRELFRAVRLEVRAVEAAGGDWRSVIDGLRPNTPAILPDCGPI